MTYRIMVNDGSFAVDVEGDTPLLWVLRDTLGMMGTKFGCGAAECGACTVLVDDQPRRSCVLPIAALGERRVTTVERLDGAEAQAVRAEWIALNVPQCGYCQSGQIVTATALLRRLPRPTDQDIDRAMAGNLCRCGTYPRIRAAIHRAAQRLAG